MLPQLLNRLPLVPGRAFHYVLRWMQNGPRWRHETPGPAASSAPGCKGMRLRQAVQLRQVFVSIRGVEEVDPELMPRNERRPRDAARDQAVLPARLAFTDDQLLGKQGAVRGYVPEEHGRVAVKIVGNLDLVRPAPLGVRGACQLAVDEQIHDHVLDGAVADVKHGAREDR